MAGILVAVKDQGFLEIERMHFKTVSAIICVVIMFSSIAAGSAKSQEIDIPFDYLFNRWIDGHQFDDTHTMYDGDFDNVADYTFGAGRHQFGLSVTQEYRVVDSKGYYFSKPLLSYSFRPTPRWQVGVDSIEYYRRYTSSSSEPLPDIIRPRRDNLTGRISSRLISDSNLKITAKNAPYFYYIDHVVGKGQFKIENELELDHQKEYDVFWRSGRAPSRDMDVDALWCLKNSVIYGFSDDLNIELNLNGYFETHSSDYVSEYVRNDTLSVLYVRGNDETTRGFDYVLTLVDLRMLPFYYNLSFGQDNTISMKYESDYTHFYDNVFERSSSYESRYDFHTESSNGEAVFGYLSNSNFDPTVILNDYNDYYHEMLFHKQFNVSLKINYHRAKSRHDYESNLTTLSFQSAIGLFDKLEIGLTADYSYGNYEDLEHFSFYPSTEHALELSDREAIASNSMSGYDSVVTVHSEGTKAGVRLKFRSYEYSDDSECGWYKDTRYDVAFGKIPDASHCYVELNYIPLDYSMERHEQIDFLELMDLSDHFGGYLDMHLSVGLGMQWALSCDYHTSLFENRSSPGYSDLTIRGPRYTYESLAEHTRLDICIIKRLKERFETSLQYQYDDWSDSEKVMGSIRLLL